MTHPRTHRLFYTLLLILASSASVAGDSTTGLEVHDAWVRESPPNAKVMAAYLTLHNHSTKTYTLTSVSSTNFERVEIHRTEQKDGMSMMLPVSRVILSTNGSVSFQPGGMHLMLTKPNKRLKVGDTVSITLHFTDDNSTTITVPVKKGIGSDDHSHHQNLHKDTHNHHDSHPH